MATYTLIASSIATSGAVASVSFTGIPQTYTDLAVLASWRASSAGGDNQLQMSINDTSYANRPNVYLQADGSTIGGSKGTAAWIVGGGNSNGSTADVFTPTLIYINSYSSTDKYKPILIDNFMSQAAAPPSAYSYTEAVAQNYENTSTTISSLYFRITNGAANLMQYTSFYLYGISNA